MRLSQIQEKSNLSSQNNWWWWKQGQNVKYSKREGESCTQGTRIELSTNFSTDVLKDRVRRTYSIVINGKDLAGKAVHLGYQSGLKEQGRT